jgi:hypothetical protein
VAGAVVIYGEGPTTTVTAAELLGMPRKAVEGPHHEGVMTTYEGVTLRDLLVRAGAIDAERVGSGDLVRWVRVEAANGYRVIYSVAELEPDFRPVVPILADRQNGVPLAAGIGPLQVVMADEMRHSRWVRQVSCLRLGRAD